MGPWRYRRLGTRLVQGVVVAAVAYVLLRKPRVAHEAALPMQLADATMVSADESSAMTGTGRSWLRGDGRWVPIAVGCVLLVALLSMLLPDRDTTTPPPIAPPPPPLAGAPAAVALPPGGAPPIGADEATWITADDYPADAIRAEETGAVTVRWRIGSDGEVSDCGVVRSSGHTRLDHAACDAILSHARYRPARDAAGWPILVTRERRVVWKLPS